MNKSTKAIIQFVVLLGVAILLVWLSMKSVWAEKDQILKSFQNANYVWVGVSVLIAFLSHFLRAYRWNYLLKPLGYKVEIKNATAAVLVGYFANYGLPRMGEITRCTLVKKYDDVPFEIALGTVITERIVDMVLLIIIFFMTLVLQFSQLKKITAEYIFDPMMLKLQGISANPTKFIILLVILIVIFLAFFLMRKKIGTLLKGKMGNVVSGFVKGLGSVKDIDNKFQFILLSFGIWLSYFYSLYACLYAFEATEDLGHSKCLVLLLFGTFGVIFTPGGLGAYQAILKGLLVSYGIAEIAAFAFPWMAWSAQFIMIVVLGVLSLILLPIINKSKGDVVSQKA